MINGADVLPKFARRFLTERSISPKLAEERGLHMIGRQETSMKFGRPCESMLIQYFDPDSREPIDFERARTFVPEEGVWNKHGNKIDVPKYLQPAGKGNHLYFDPVERKWRDILGDPAKPLVITEGEFKAMAATEQGIACVALSGVWSWRTRVKGQSVVLPEFDRIEWKGRRVEIVFDSDAATKPDVRAAQAQLARELRRRGADVAQVPLPDAADGEKCGLDDFLAAKGRKAFDALPRNPVGLILDPAKPYDTALDFLALHYTDEEGRLLHHYRGEFFGYADTHYEAIENAALDSRLWDFLNGALRRVEVDGRTKLEPFAPTIHRVKEVREALKAKAHLSGKFDAPCWADSGERVEGVLVACRNGLLDPKTRALVAPSPGIFITNSVPFDYDESHRRKIKHWVAFLESLWPGDPDAVATLQEIFGYILTLGAHLDKAFLLIGPTRSGKGTIARVLQALLGPRNCCSPTFATLAAPFGLQPLLNKQLAIISDARLTARTDAKALLENLLRITGRDDTDVHRKHTEAWHGRLPTRFLILTNELPKVADPGGAFAGRLIVLATRESWLDREDRALEGRLHAELPGIFLWALDGADRLAKRGRFTRAESGERVRKAIEEMGEPVKAFVREHYTFGSKLSHTVPTANLYQHANGFFEVRGMPKLSDVEFGRQLAAAFPKLERGERRIEGERVAVYKGIARRARPRIGVPRDAEG